LAMVQLGKLVVDLRFLHLAVGMCPEGLPVAVVGKMAGAGMVGDVDWTLEAALEEMIRKMILALEAVVEEAFRKIKDLAGEVDLAGMAAISRVRAVERALELFAHLSVAFHVPGVLESILRLLKRRQFCTLAPSEVLQG
jgi:hypothetical protein